LALPCETNSVAESDADVPAASSDIDTDRIWDAINGNSWKACVKPACSQVKIPCPGAMHNAINILFKLQAFFATYTLV